MMRAILLSNYAPQGTPVSSVVAQHQVPRPTLKPDDVVIRVRACSVNNFDVVQARGYARSIVGRRWPLPTLLGRDCAGVVEEVGNSVVGLKRGDAVVAALNPLSQGVFAEFAVANVAAVAHKPKALSFAQSAALAYAGVTAWEALFETYYAALRPPAVDADKDNVREELPVTDVPSRATAAFLDAVLPSAVSSALGTTLGLRNDSRSSARGLHVLVHGGSGAVGSIAVQLLKFLGAHVTVTCSERSFQHCRDDGADEIYTHQQLERDVPAGTFDVVIDAVGGAGGEQLCVPLVRSSPVGRYVTLKGPMVESSDAADDSFGAAAVPLGLAQGAASVLESTLRNRVARNVQYSQVLMHEDGGSLQRLLVLAARDVVRPRLHPERFSFDNVQEAFDLYESRQAQGKIIIAPDVALAE